MTKPAFHALLLLSLLVGPAMVALGADRHQIVSAFVAVMLAGCGAIAFEILRGK